MSTATIDLAEETRISLLENNHYHICKTLERIENTLVDFKTEVRAELDKIEGKFEIVYEKFDRVDEKFDRIDDKFGRLDEKIGRLEDRLWSIFLWMIGTVTVPVCASIIVYIGKDVLTYLHLI